MIIIVCIDNDGGMLFNKRRQSSDLNVTEKIIELAAGKILWMSSYSYQLFKKYTNETKINADDKFLLKASCGDFCFVEGQDISNIEKSIEAVIVFKWNRSYPFDVKFDCNIMEMRKLVYTEDFKGNSHEKITMEVYMYESEK